MKDTTTTQGLSPLGIRIQGSGKYVKEQVEHLEDYFDMMHHDFLEELRQENE